jgi:hypothetical protein
MTRKLEDQSRRDSLRAALNIVLFMISFTAALVYVVCQLVGE